jgi:DNA polymerase I-like protein with 3'-5' exonuclease and polymerase domains
MGNIYGLDIETKSLLKNHPEYALQPFRLRQGKAKVWSIDAYGPDGYVRQIIDPTRDQTKELLRELAAFGRPVFGHNVTFDVSWLLLLSGDFDLINSIKWQDTGLLAKWVYNSQTTEHPQFSFALSSLCKRFLSDHPHIEEFLGIKDESHVAGDDESYWHSRGTLDAMMTKDLATYLRSKLDPSQRRGFEIEQECIAYMARSNVNGIPLDKEYIESLPVKIKAAMTQIEKQLPVSGSVVRSPTQLSNYLFNTLGLDPIERGKPTKSNPKGNGSTKAGHLKRFRIQNAGNYIGDILGNILNYKQLSTLQTKYVDGLLRTMAYTGEAVMYPSARLFGTYTGRFTYGSMIDRKQSMQFSIACHQLPRKGPIKKCLVPPEGMWMTKNDGAQQELRIIGCVANESGLIHEFNSGLDVHSTMSAFVANMTYEDFMKGLEAKEADIINYRYAGKLLNLSCQYRIGAASLMDKFFETYGIIITKPEAYYYLNLYKQRYPGVVRYWEQTSENAEKIGYASTFADRRFYINEWGSKRWASESSAINFPIQGGAADHKELTLVLLSKMYPEIEFFLDIHDEICFYTPQDEALVKDLAHSLGSLSDQYRQIWGKTIPIDLPFDCVLCKENFKEGTLIKEN